MQQFEIASKITRGAIYISEIQLLAAVYVLSPSHFVFVLSARNYKVDHISYTKLINNHLTQIIAYSGNPGVMTK